MKSCTYVLVAAMAVTGTGMSLRAADNMADNAANTGAQMEQTGAQMADQAVAKEARKTLARIVNDGVERNKFNSFIDYLAKADRDRIGSASKSNLDTLNTAIDQFRQDFKSKYNQNFDISADAFQSAVIYAGHDKNSATVSFANPAQSSNQPNSVNGSINTNINANTSNAAAMNNANSSTDVNGGATSDRTLNTTGNDRTVSNRNGQMSGADTTSMTAGVRTGPASNGANSNNIVHGNDTTANPGVVSENRDSLTVSSTNNTNSAIVNNNGMNNANTMAMSSLTLNLINEGHVMNAWRISAPQLSLEQIKQNLTRHIQMLDDQKSAWPSDVNQAYQAAAYHVLQAFNDTTMATDR